MGSKQSTPEILPENVAFLTKSRLAQDSYTSENTLTTNQHQYFHSPRKDYKTYCCCLRFPLKTFKGSSWQAQTLASLEQRKFRKFQWPRAVRATLDRLGSDSLVNEVQRQSVENLKTVIAQFQSDPSISKIYVRHPNESDNDSWEFLERPNQIVQEQETSRVSEKAFYQQITKLIESQFKERGNPCGEILRDFKLHIAEFEASPSFLQRQSYRLSPSKMERDEVRAICEEIQSFVSFFIQSFFHFYDLLAEVQEQRLLSNFTPTNMSSFTLTLLFFDDRVYQRVKFSFKLYYQEENQSYYRNVLKMAEEPMSFFEIPRKLMLADTDSYLEAPDTFNPSVQKSALEQPVAQNEAYDQAVKVFRNLESTRTPTQQLRIIMRTFKEISSCITNYYQSQEQINLTSKEILAIMQFVVVRSQVKELGIILKMIENFTPKNTMKSPAGYKLVTVQSCYSEILRYESKQGRRISPGLKSKSQIVGAVLPLEEQNSRSVMEY